MMNFKVTKIGLLNFWYFDDEVFNFCDGKLLLRGSNGSGKSVTMQSFIPLILDGNKLPSRLDPFGTKEKRIEDYILGSSDGDQKDDATSYLYMEAYNDEKDKFITVGIGLHARKGRPTDFWGFALKDGKRIGIDFQLYKNYTTKILMSKKELRANIGVDNFFVESTRDYKSMVNNLLFGFEDLDSYDEFINVLLQLRSSKLSKEYNPVKLMGILSSVLQPLTDDDIRPLSEAIEDTNKTKEKIDILNSNIRDLGYLSKVYQNYNEIILYGKAKAVVDELNIVKSIDKEISFQSKEVDNKNERLQEIERRINELNQELVQVNTKLANFDNKDMISFTERLSELKRDISKVCDDIRLIKDKLERESAKEKKYENDIKDVDNKIYLKDKDILSISEDIFGLNEDVKVPDISLCLNKEVIEFDYLDERLAKFKSKVSEIKKLLEERDGYEVSLSKLEEESERVKKELLDKENVKKSYLSSLHDEIEVFKDKVNEIEKKSEIVKFEPDNKRKMFDLIDDYSSLNYLEARNIFQKEVKYYETRIIEEKSGIENKLLYVKQELVSLNEELDELKSNEELEFHEDDSFKTAEDLLKSKNIPYIPLYKVIDFKSNVSEDDRNKLEELLISTNVLNAKIVPLKYLNDVSNIKSNFLKKGKFKKNSLLSYFDVCENDVVSKKEISDILSSISADINDDVYINSDRFELDFMIGYPSSDYKNKYIGLMRRKEEHERLINLKKEEISNKEKIVNNYVNLLDNNKNKLNDISNVLNMFPSNKELDDTILDITKIEAEFNLLFERSKKIINDENILNNKILEKTSEINMCKGSITIPLNLAAFNNALILIDEMIKKVLVLRNCFESRNSYVEQRNSIVLSLESVREDLEYQNAELSAKNIEKGNLESKKAAIDEILANPEYVKQLDELKRLTERSKQIPEDNYALIEEKGKILSVLENFNKLILDNCKRLDKEKLILQLKQVILEKEYNLGYVYRDEKLDVNKIVNDLCSREGTEKSKAFENYIIAFNNYKQSLLDYRLNTKEIFVNNDDIFNEYLNRGLDEENLSSVFKTMSRQDLETTYQGKKLNIYELTDCLKASVLESENYISIQERHLFEDILLKTVGNKIRDKIESSKEWVKKINEIMKSTQIDSNLSFELEWVSKQAFTEDELDTKELVRLFKIDAGQLNKKDSERLIGHFRSQIKKEIEFGNGVNDSYSSVIFNVLDYRNWFDFKLYYKRKSGERRELTNKVFSILSGGERAKSMYVPLFAAVYAKLLNARDSSLRLIALDEAFAGVDNANIREMFDILGQLNLDYVLTSQSLWGDYDTVRELSICELIKDEVHKAVGVRHYRWNGFVKEILEKSDLYV